MRYSARLTYQAAIAALFVSGLFLLPAFMKTHQVGAVSLPEPTYPCAVSSVKLPPKAEAGSTQEAQMTVTYDSVEPLKLSLSLQNGATRESLGDKNVSVSGKGETQIVVPFTVPSKYKISENPATGKDRITYQVNYYSSAQKQNVSCKNGADIVPITILEPFPVMDPNTSWNINVAENAAASSDQPLGLSTDAGSTFPGNLLTSPVTYGALAIVLVVGITIVVVIVRKK